MRIRIKKLHPDAVVPRYAHFGDAAVDLVATTKWKDDKGNICYGTGLAMEIPDNHVGLMFPRSSVSKKDLRLCNSVGVIDAGYRGDIIACVDNIKNVPYTIQQGSRLFQLCGPQLEPIQFQLTNDLSNSQRGAGGFGSTGQ